MPSKFVSYIQGGLPVLAIINAGNDQTELITRERVGRVCTYHSVDILLHLAEVARDPSPVALAGSARRALRACAGAH